MAHCHCSMCRKFHGAGFATYGHSKKDDFRWVEGEQLLSSYIASNGTTRSFCSRCGSSLVFKGREGEENEIIFALGTLDSDISQQPDAHIFVEFKANWVELNDELPKFKQEREHET